MLNIFTSIVLCVLISPSVFGQLVPMSYQEAKTFVAQPTPAIQAALDSFGNQQVYQFLNADGDDSVDYVGQTFRQVLINDIKLIASSIARGDFEGDVATSFATLDSVYSYQVDLAPASNKAINGRSRHLVTAKTADDPEMGIYEGAFYSSIYPKTTNLQVKTAGVDNPTINSVIRGWNSPTLNGVTIDDNGDGQKSPEEFIRAIMQGIAVNAAAPDKFLVAKNPGQPDEIIRQAAVTAEGVDLAQLLQKILHGAVSFSQATSDYLSIELGDGKGLLADNQQLLPGRPFTTLQHHWDEAFGYFGAARDYGSYSDQEITGGFAKDTFADENYGTGDSEISLERELNFGLAVGAAKRDLGDVDGQSDFTGDIYQAFLKGRFLIQNQPAGYLEYAQALATIAAVEWEKVIAASAIHYINTLMKDYAAFGTAKFKFSDLAKHFGELKGFALAVQFSPLSPMTIAQFDRLHILLGDQPAVPGSSAVDSYRAQLGEARQLLGEVYGFSTTQVENW